MSLSSSPADSTSPQPLVLSSPDRVVFRAIPHTLAPTNKRVTLSLRKSPTAARPTDITPAAAVASSIPTALDTLPAVKTPTSPSSEPTTVPLNHQSPNSHRRSSSLTTLTDLELVTVSSTASAAIPTANKSSTTTKSNPSNTSYPEKLSPRVTINNSLVRKQGTTQLLLKNGLPIKSAMKSPLATPSPNNASPVALCRPSSVRSHSSPSPLSSPKYVHFNTQLEHVRLFLQGETPSCIAERETIIDCRQENSTTSVIKLTLLNWSVVTPGSFQPGNIDAGASPLKVENMTLSEDQTQLRGTVLIHNIAFHKHVSVRFTVDFWRTQTELMADYMESIPGSALDRFAFVIPLEMEDRTMVEKTFCFAVRYQVIGREFWDSNNGMNYQLECKRVVVVAPSSSATTAGGMGAMLDLSKQMNNIVLAARMPDYGKPVLKKKHSSRYDFSTSLSAAYSGSSTPSNASTSWLEPSAAQKSAYRPSEYISPVQSPPGYHHSLYASSPKFISPYLSTTTTMMGSPNPEHFQLGFEQLSLENSMIKKSNGGFDPDVTVASPMGPTRSQSYPSGFYGSPPKLSSSSPISIPSGQAPSNRPAVGSSSYYDLVDRYCFYESSPHSSPYTSPYSSYPNSPPATCIRG
ncbi:hypothetical protein BGZ83_008020 [Gryganskiella cystojenkinii]|nr:hypothetical protein BGZ83_008020 [Gryganskiella cystojenkinii]